MTPIGDRPAPPAFGGGDDFAISARRSRTIFIVDQGPLSIQEVPQPISTSRLPLLWPNLQPRALLVNPLPRGIISFPRGGCGDFRSRGRRAPQEPEQLSGQPERLSPPTPQESGPKFYERWLGMTRSWEEVNASLSLFSPVLGFALNLPPSTLTCYCSFSVYFASRPLVPSNALVSDAELWQKWMT
ncbi:unnamed protein product [Arabis nemorensis]|uniref:Uncharacterized protein n=1 Tax=Arabis nemorensis TaxID=586526 RepID=A0A565B1K4_9BRAS|nr:unnamed protein product [Arabis nemorensis]